MLKQAQHDIIFITNLLTTHYSKFTKKVFAFTLAETLIVMGVIGVVAALTLPNLNQSTNNKEKVVKVKKIYQNLNDAFGRATAVYGSINEWSVDDLEAKFGDRMAEFMKLSKNCGFTVNTGCFSKGKPKYVNTGNHIIDIENSNAYYKIITADGTSIAFDTQNNQIFIDIDGLNKGSYTLGKDLFVFKYDPNKPNDGVYPLYPPNGSSFSALISNLYDSGVYASYWIINYDNMDYLKFTNSTGKCKNGTTVTESNPRCN